MPVRVGIWIAQFGGNPVFQPLGNKMFQTLGFGVNFIPRKVENIMKKSFQEPMMAHNFERAMLARLC